MGAGKSADDFAAIENSQWYQKFMNHCPSGQLTLHEFKTILGLRDMNPQANKYVEQVFHVFDKNQTLNLRDINVNRKKRHFLHSNLRAKKSLPGDGPAPETHHYYSKFMRECPPGQLSLHVFKKILGLQGLDPQGDIYIKKVFDIFDLNQ
ncbi:hypothetical protein QYF61_016764, partial [Mycteria americana]